jgi:ParB family chromosome partitioning protein
MAKKMTTNKSKLGRGMAALLSTNIETMEEPKQGNRASTGSMQETLIVPVEKIIPNKDQPRKIFKEDKLEELSRSIKENGIIQPLIVTENESGELELIAGERRLRASIKAGIEMVPVVIKKVTKKDGIVMSIIENVQRSDLNCIEEALAYFQLMNDFNLTQEEVAKKIGKERSSIANYLRLLKLPRMVIDYLQKDDLSMGHAKCLLSLKDEATIKTLAALVVEESLSVRELEEKIKGLKNTKAKTNSKEEDMSLFRDKIENRTGFHVNIKKKNNGKGMFSIVFSSEEEFNSIYDFLMK